MEFPGIFYGNKQSRTADKGWSSNLGLGEKLITHRKK
jgi:hypothetical protein